MIERIPYPREVAGRPGGHRTFTPNVGAKSASRSAEDADNGWVDARLGAMCDVVEYCWRGSVSDDEMVELVESYGGRPVAGWWDSIQSFSLGWVTARDHDGVLVGFVNVAWDGGDHAFLLDTKTRGNWRRRGVGTEVVRRAAHHAQVAGCEWLHVDFEPHLGSFYFDACGFRRMDAGLIHLRSAD